MERRMESFTKGGVVIYEGYMEDILCIFDYSDGDFVYLNELNGEPFRSTTFDRIRKASVKDLIKELNRLESMQTTLIEALEIMEGAKP